MIRSETTFKYCLCVGYCSNLRTSERRLLSFYLSSSLTVCVGRDPELGQGRLIANVKTMAIAIDVPSMTDSESVDSAPCSTLAQIPCCSFSLISAVQEYDNSGIPL